MKDQTISIQLGPFSNYVGTHLWNLREINSVDSTDNNSSLYRSSSNQHQKSYPRVLAIDYRENIHPISSPINQAIIDPTQSRDFWSSPVDVHYQQSSLGSDNTNQYDNT